jgi:FAD synthase
MVGFEDVDSLVAQMKEDVEQTRDAALSPVAAR